MINPLPEAEIEISKVVPLNGATCVIDSTVVPIAVEPEVLMSLMVKLETFIGAEKTTLKIRVVQKNLN